LTHTVDCSQIRKHNNNYQAIDHNISVQKMRWPRLTSWKFNQTESYQPALLGGVPFYCGLLLSAHSPLRVQPTLPTGTGCTNCVRVTA